MTGKIGARKATEQHSIIFEEDLNEEGEIVSKSTFQFDELNGVGYGDRVRRNQQHLPPYYKQDEVVE
jgi:hypothetical protein